MGLLKRIFGWLFGSDEGSPSSGEKAAGDDRRSRQPSPDGSTPPDTNYPLF